MQRLRFQMCVTLGIVMLKLPVKRHFCTPFCNLCSLILQCLAYVKHVQFRKHVQA